MRLLVAFIAAWCCIARLPATAATIKRLLPEDGFWNIQDATWRGCSLRLEGSITPGDADTLKTFLSDNIKDTICLNSEGGSYAEGVALGQIFRDMTVTTVVDKNDTCLSACAVAFMAGSEVQPESAEPNLARYLHVRGKLAFHAPYISGDGGADMADAAYRSGVDAIRRLIALGEKYKNNDVFPLSLLNEMLVKGPNEAYAVDTNTKAIAYKIQLIGLEEPRQVSSAMSCAICMNVLGGAGFECESGQPMSVEKIDRGLKYMTKTPHDGTAHTTRCAVTFVWRLASYDLAGDMGASEGNADPAYFYPPGTLLENIPEGTPSNSPFSFGEGDLAAVSPPPTYFWTHNGSTMRLTAEGAKRKFAYEAPREGMKAEGIGPGTVLFEGERSGNQYSGVAYVFNSRCGKAPYRVAGFVSADDRSVMLVGKAPRFDAKCKLHRYVDDKLLFEFTGPPD